jgi:hypothetical protein
MALLTIRLVQVRAVLPREDSGKRNEHIDKRE